MVPHPVLSVISWVIAAASAAWLVILGVSLALNVASGVSHDSELMMLTYGVYMACAFGFCCFGTFFALHFGLGRTLIGVIRFVTRIIRTNVLYFFV